MKINDTTERTYLNLDCMSPAIGKIVINRYSPPHLRIAAEHIDQLAYTIFLYVYDSCLLWQRFMAILLNHSKTGERMVCRRLAYNS